MHTLKTTIPCDLNISNSVWATLCTGSLGYVIYKDKIYGHIIFFF